MRVFAFMVLLLNPPCFVGLGCTPCKLLKRWSPRFGSVRGWTHNLPTSCSVFSCCVCLWPEADVHDPHVDIQYAHFTPDAFSNTCLSVFIEHVWEWLHANGANANGWSGKRVSLMDLVNALGLPVPFNRTNLSLDLDGAFARSLSVLCLFLLFFCIFFPVFVLFFFDPHFASLSSVRSGFGAHRALRRRAGGERHERTCRQSEYPQLTNRTRFLYVHEELLGEAWRVPGRNWQRWGASSLA